MSVYGVRGRKSNEVILRLEEYEAIRLLDYQNLTQEQAAVHMDVSRPTLTRIYEEARNKVATAFVEGVILFSGVEISISMKTGISAKPVRPVLTVMTKKKPNVRFAVQKM
jgi:predicted DNA-binding protein (UPF0251 family)